MPQRPDYKTALSVIREQVQSKDFARSLRESAMLLEQNSNIAELWSLQGQSLQGLGRLAEAEACYRTGLELCSGAPRLLVQLGHLLSRQNRGEEACDCFAQAMAADATLTDAYRGLLNFRAIPLDSPEVATLLKLALDTERSHAARARALFLLGQIYTESGLDNPGFAFYEQANRFAAADLKGTREYQVSPSAAGMDRPFFSRYPRRQAAPHCPLLVVAGLPRSGKSLVETLLAQHPGVVAGGELALVRKLAASLPAEGNLHTQAKRLVAQAESPLLQLCPPLEGAGARYLTDTSPANLSRLGWLGLLHPEVPVVLCRRAPLDLGLALFFKNFRSGHRYSYQLATIGRAMALAEKLIDHWQAALPNPLLQVQYETLVREPDVVRKALTTLLALDDTGRAEQQAPGTARTWRIFPSRSLDSVGEISPALVGFAHRFRHQLAPMMQAYTDELARPRLSSPPEPRSYRERRRKRSRA
ncbi:sulfotransferase [Haliea sp.]|uniref:tetratricopeptide repeat-containing sulfotransferase family protein n=1 Tax=Haliea sp. TaxID=1932666 RepID=UPI00352880BB